MVRFFPIDLIGDILCRLPVKSLVRFKSVSRPWYSLIDDPCFVGSHLKHATETNRGSKLITRFLSEFDFLCAEDLDSLGTGNLVKLGLPTKNNWSEYISLLGSCNGLICLGDCENLILWNKSTGEYQNVGLPPGVLNQEQKLLPFRSYGFGYDSKNDDYKIKGIVDYYSRDHVFRWHGIEVYSLRNNTWKSIRCKGLPFFSGGAGGAKTEDQMAKGLLACGALNWLVFWDDLDSYNKHFFIYSFDLATELFHEIALPENTNCGAVGELGGHLTATCCESQVGRRADVDIWVIEDVVTNSWTKLFRISGGCLLKFVRPLAYLRSSNKILFKSDLSGFFWYNPGNGELEAIYTDYYGCIPAATEICLDTLVSISAYTDCQRQKTKEKSKKRPNLSAKKNQKQSNIFKRRGADSSTLTLLVYLIVTAAVVCLIIF